MCINRLNKKTLETSFQQNGLQIEAVLSTVQNKQISFMGHINWLSENRISRKIVEKLWFSKSRNIGWIAVIKEHIEELRITLEHFLDYILFTTC